MSSISSFDIISAVVCEAESKGSLEPNIFLCIPVSVADAAAVNPNRTETILCIGLITIFINGNLVFSNVPISIPRNPPDCVKLDN